ncbi:hypothetical protein M378DRAFT_17197 [Amanita muscaria Koide BX008]|uniref:Uncharacterized protein n=1 Tax=Amanita muscaria (strain Koide BX008) TaxID=946122 RepID=A0A0C2WI37_AMAMK|nr:hypothetical protein M378DRAFT_17197 [Amanita muscaria Koide BX008]
MVDASIKTPRTTFVIHEDRLYFDQVEIYFDHDTRRWRSRVGDNPLSDEPFLGPEYVPGNPEEELPTHLRTQSTVVVGPVNQGTVFSGGWKGKGKPSQSIRSAETEEEPTEENCGEGSSSGNDIARIRAMIEALDEEDQIEVLRKDF